MTFNAVLKVGKDMRFGVTSPGGAQSEWIAVGDSFAGLKLTAFDEDRETLVFTQNGQEVRVPLASGSVQKLNTKATLEQAAEVISKMKFDQMLGKMLEQQKQSLLELAKQMAAEQGSSVTGGEMGAYQSKLLDALWAEMRPEELQREFTRIYSEVYTRDELRGMSDFYSTAAGQATVEKQPLLQQKMLEVMMPRMLRARPKLEEVTRQFTAEQAAKAKAAGGAVAK